MVQYDRRAIGLAYCLSALAGYIDAIGFIALGGFFVSFMTGNSTRLGVDLARLDTPGILIAGGMILSFILGVMAGSLVGHVFGRRQRPAVLGFVTLCLAGAALLQDQGLIIISVSALAVAMGAENAVFQRDGEVSIGLTYMTGTLVKMGQRLTAALIGGAKRDWLRPLLLWLSLVAGTTLGAFAHAKLGLDAIWAAAAGAAVLTLLAVALDDK